MDRSSREARMVPGEDESKASLLAIPEEDIIQFSTKIYFADENDGQVTIGVMRIGSGHGRAKVSYCTVDGSAHAGDQYEATSGELVFEDGEKDASFDVVIADDDAWHATNEFKVCLSQPDNCTLGKYLHTARVKILDNNAFPSDKYADQLDGEESVFGISGPGLFWEFFKLNFGHDDMWLRTTLLVIFDQINNIQLLVQTWMSMYMVDVVFNIRDPESVKKLRFFETRISEAYLMAALHVILVAVVHVWDVQRVNLDVDGCSKAFLRRNLIRRYLNLDDKSLLEVNAGRLQFAFMDETQQLASGYSAVCGVVKAMGTVIVLAIFTLHSNPDAWWILVLLPGLMAVFLLVRIKVSPEIEDSGVAKKALIDLLEEMLRNYKVIANYSERPKINEKVATTVTRLRDTQIPEGVEERHNEHIPNWIAALFVAIYMFAEAPAVLGTPRSISLGTFLATISIIKDFAGSFANLYMVYLQVVDSFDPIRDITWLFSLKTDLLTWKEVSHKRALKSRESRRTLTHSLEDTLAAMEAGEENVLRNAADRMEISIKDVYFHYRPEDPVLENVSLSTSQGKIVAVHGAHGSGKRALLELIGHSIFPVDGMVLVPGHLRTLQVEQGVKIFETWSPLENLCFGSSGEDVELVQSVLAELNMVKTLKLVATELKHRKAAHGAHEDAAHSLTNWQEALSETEKCKLCLARALIANPEILILHKPLQNYMAEEKSHIMQIIIDYVKNRGLCLDPATVHYRRPRTCFFSALDVKDTSFADVVWKVDGVENSVHIRRTQSNESLSVRRQTLLMARSETQELEEKGELLRRASQPEMSGLSSERESQVHGRVLEAGW